MLKNKFLQFIFRKKENGFTLLELLVVISIIGLISTAAMVIINTARENSRDGKRKADLVQIHKALQLYADDNGDLPAYSNGLALTNRDTGAVCFVAYGSLDDSLVSYTQVPHDPLGGGCWGNGNNGYRYYDSFSGTVKSGCGLLMAWLENPSDDDEDSCSTSACVSTGGWPSPIPTFCMEVE